MGFMIQLLFEPSLLGVEYVFCTGCGCVTRPEDAGWKTDSNPSSNRDAIGHDVDESPHHPMCPRCSTEIVIADAVCDGFTIKLREEPVLYPRRKPIKVWKEVEPYRTKRGSMSTWKLNEEAGALQSEFYDRTQKQLSTPHKLSKALKKHRYRKMAELLDVYGDVGTSRGFRALLSTKGLVLIRERRVWHGAKRPKLDKEGKPATWRKSRESFAGMSPFEPKTMWHHTSEVSDPKWVKMEDYSEVLDEFCPMDRGAFITLRDQSVYWFDPSKNGYVMVDGPGSDWHMCQYDEAQGEDEEVLYDEMDVSSDEDVEDEPHEGCEVA